MSIENETTHETFEEEQMDLNEQVIGEYLIFDQSASILDAWREAIQNAADAPNSTEVTVTIDPDEQRSVIEDDGDGMDLGDDEMREFIRVLGESTKKDDPDTIGQFGIGFGQVLAKGEVTVRTRNWVVTWDAKTDPALSYEIGQTEDYVDGFRVEIDHYEDEVPHSTDTKAWDSHLRDLRKRFRFFGLTKDVAITLNGDLISDDTPADAIVGTPDLVRETDTAWYAMRQRDKSKVAVYSAGLKVTWANFDGVYGYVVTKDNLDLNMSRDSIKSGCPIWTTVQREMTEMRTELLKDTNRLTEDGRKAVVDAMDRDPQSNVNRFREREVFRMSNGRSFSYSDLQSCDSIMVASEDDVNADKLVERGFTVLREMDAATQALLAADNLSVPDRANYDEMLDEADIRTEYEIEDDESEWPQTAMTLATILARRMESTMNEPRREIKYGYDDSARAWTRGTDTEIVLTDSAMRGRGWKVTLPQIWRELCHEYSHQSSDMGNLTHSEKFNETFRDWIDKTESDLVELIEEIQDEGLWNKMRQDESVDETRFES